MDVHAEHDRGALVCLTQRESWLPGGRFDPGAMMDLLRQAEQQALDDGFSGLRATWNMGWVLEGTASGADRLMEYEAHLNRFLAGSRTCALCRYSREASSAAKICRSALHTHPLAVLGEQICPNAFYEPPDMVLGDRSPDERIDWMIAQLQRARFSEAKLEDVTLRLSQKRAALERADRAKEELLSMLAHELRNPLGTISNALQVLRMKGEGDETCEAGHRRRRAPGPPPGDADRRPARGLPRHPRRGRAAVRGARPGRAGARDRRGLPRGARARPGSTLDLDLPDASRCRCAATGCASPRRSPTCWTTPPSSPPRAAASPCGSPAARRPAGRGHRARQRRRHPARGAALRLRGLHPGRPQPRPLAGRPGRGARRGQGAGRAARRRGRGARSEGPGRAAEFTLLLPLDPTARPAGRGVAEARRTPDGGRRAAILVVEDNPDAAATMRDFLELSGHEVELAASGADGVQAAREFHPEVVLCDIGLPGHGRLRGGRELRAIPRPARAKLIAVTGYGRDEDRRRSKEAGFDLHLTKPVDPAKLRAVLRVPR